MAANDTCHCEHDDHFCALDDSDDPLDWIYVAPADAEVLAWHSELARLATAWRHFGRDLAWLLRLDDIAAAIERRCGRTR